MTVTLRFKVLSKGRKSLYLDFYPAVYNPVKGIHTRREFLNLYLIDKPKNEIEKEQNKETKALAESIRSKRQLELQRSNYDFFFKHQEDKDFLSYFKELSEHKHAGWISCYLHLNTFTNGHLPVKNVTDSFCANFKEYLLSLIRNKKLSQNTASNYFNKFRAALRKGFEDKLFHENPVQRIRSIKEEETHREYLTLEELNVLVKTECELPEMKKAALFSAMTGLRWGDIEKLTWGQIQHSAQTGYCIRLRQEKTDGTLTLPVSEQAISMLGEKGNTEDKIFKDLKYSAWHNLKLANWVKDAGITKHITFHCFRHTYATLQLSLDTDIYTVSKMLGHKNLKTTQIYAKVVDKKKIEAANKIQLDL